MTSHPPLVQALLQPEVYPERPASVELAETHISHLFFTPRHVYKVKKAVNFGFLDFTTLEKRRYYCHQEVELNRRLSPQVYLGVVEVRLQGGRYTVEGLGETVEYAVKMQRLPQERLLATLLRQGEVTSEDIRRLAVKIADFHAGAETRPSITRLGGIEAVRQNVEENFAQTRQYVGTCLSQDLFDDLEAYSQVFMAVREGLFWRREAQGCVRDCHGDLHTGQIFLENGISIIDCIEFNERFRYSDVAADLAFLAMDLDFYNRQDLSRFLVDTYVEASGDPGVRELMDFFKVYRAYVRGKVTAFRLDDSALEGEERRRVVSQAQAYFHLAHSYAQPLPRPALILVCGLTGAGKTTVAQELARRWGLAFISSDQVRKELAGIAATEHQYVPFGQGIYSPEFSQRTYQTMLQRATEELSQGSSVVLDATFRRAGERLQAVALARSLGVETWVVECVLEEGEVRRRLEERVRQGGSVSDSRWELYGPMQEQWESVEEVPPSRYLRVDTRPALQEVMPRLSRAWYEHQLRG